MATLKEITFDTRIERINKIVSHPSTLSISQLSHSGIFKLYKTEKGFNLEDSIYLEVSAMDGYLSLSWNGQKQIISIVTYKSRIPSHVKGYRDLSPEKQYKIHGCRRHQFTCPRCGRACRKLHLCCDAWICSKCLLENGYRYRSQYPVPQSHKNMQTLIERVEKNKNMNFKDLREALLLSRKLERLIY